MSLKRADKQRLWRWQKIRQRSEQRIIATRPDLVGVAVLVPGLPRWASRAEQIRRSANKLELPRSPRRER